MQMIYIWCKVLSGLPYTCPGSFVCLVCTSFHFLLGERQGMVQEWKKAHKTLALWFGELMIEQKSIWSKSPSCHMSLMDTEQQQVPGKAGISQSLPRLISWPSHSRDLLSRRDPVGLNYPSWIYLIHFLGHISAFGLSSFLWWWVPSCKKSMQTSPHVSFMRDLVNAWLMFWQPQKASESSHCEDVEVSWRGKKGNYPQINQIFLGFCCVGLNFFFFLTCWFHCFCDLY